MFFPRFRSPDQNYSISNPGSTVKKITDQKSGSASKNVSGVWKAKKTNLKIKIYK
jgi:hypothetical protein